MNPNVSTATAQGARVPSQHDPRPSTLPTRSPKGVVLRVVRSAMAADWAPFAAADELVTYVDGDVRLLEVAQSRIQACSSGTTTVMQARALATLNVAITRVHEQGGRP